MPAVQFIAHGEKDDDGKIRYQSVHDHLLQTRDLCEQFGSSLNLAYVAGLAGWLHDAGKYSKAFQLYIRKSLDEDPSAKRGAVNHAFGGAHMLRQLFANSVDDNAIYMTELVENVIMAHHNADGPYDFLSPVKGESPFLKRVDGDISDWNVSELEAGFFSDFSRDEYLAYVEKAVAEIAVIPADVQDAQQSFYLRFLASCLIDADHLETGNFMADISNGPIATSDKLEVLYTTNEAAVKKQAREDAADQESGRGQINKLRGEMSDLSWRAGQDKQGVYSLSVPTGGGKTFASLRFALAQCQQHHLERIIIVAPYTTIIEQNAEAIREWLSLSGDDDTTVLEYHSAISDGPKSARYYYAHDTWDAPIVMTTQVAYLNALYGSGSKNLRHMHRLVNSVVVFDEIQSMPTKTVEMNNAAINWLADYGKTTVLLCTATQPALSHDVLPLGIDTPTEIVPDIPNAERAFKRVQLLTQNHQVWTVEDLISAVKEELDSSGSSLIVMNTKKAVRQSFEAFQNQYPAVKAYHLSTGMCGAHRKEVIGQIHDELAEHQQLVVFSTQLIEAGVDLSFGSVFRSLAGIDSVIQAAGRCNRNHEVNLGNVHLIKMDSSVENLSRGLADISAGAGITETLLTKYSDWDPLSAEFVQQYFRRYFNSRKMYLDYPATISGQRLNLLSLLVSTGNGTINDTGVVTFNRHNQKSAGEQLLNYSAPQTVTKNFQVIDSKTTPVLVQWREGKKIAETLLSGRTDLKTMYDTLKQAQQYVVQVYADSQSLEQALRDGILEYHEASGLWIARESSYNDQFGLDLQLGSQSYYF
ncbi:CRISPR-associated helicase/endonuclease Cas3 [Schleiferilactobacillus shenzhenensis]|uniref:CRISPR-associated helicase Cas3 n=1 Tax=Schleiferilactobacillus shenzhenensis LY-73 TaxID=1231336 RepID=U4TYF1_9LACO|nr:CRISPR-associated helicase/endonuclease Cas3 [Schleiferilactobacillus shenzhenensis]ERL66332.1 hypothetical protein L248_0011 [Schleiferilactobacillus shenzhenensis LY-73]